MNKEQKLHIADTLKEQRFNLNHTLPRIEDRKYRMEILEVMVKLDDLEMYVRMLPVEE